MKKISFIIIFIIIASGEVLFNSCAPTKEIKEKSGAQLWGENCNRCHNAPTIDQYSKEQWGIIIPAHMRREAGLTDAEVGKIVNFLKQTQYPW